MALAISVIIMNKELKEYLMLLAERYETPAFIRLSRFLVGIIFYTRAI